eukprot:TRINITY_DN55202_c0_g1_i1.p1 TRINITY_DN55202_c0_g1~~TRINITY_DN55202_c0_g1_i1.p1  ORF type:complete len:406 (-),score=47.26 TRINITY_DN55202_c0_g1_i1:5-1222(-)
MSCRWAAEYAEILCPELAERAARLAPCSTGKSILCFHGTSKSACRQIARTGFDASFRSPALSKIVPYLVGEYLSSDPSIALKYSRQKETSRETLSLLVVEMPASNFEMRNGVWFQPKLSEAVVDANGNARETREPDFSQSYVCVCEDERVLVPRALVTFRPGPAVKNAGSAMVCYDRSLQEQFDSRLMSSDDLPQAVLLELDVICWPYTLANESHGPPFAPLADDVGVSDCKGKCLRLCKDLAEILRVLYRAKIQIVLCSRSGVPGWCKEFIESCPLHLTEDPGLKFGDVLHPASIIRPSLRSTGHLQQIKTALDVPFQQLLFFDSNKRSCEDGRRLGVRCMHVPRPGMTMERFAAGLRMFFSLKCRALLFLSPCACEEQQPCIDDIEEPEASCTWNESKILSCI